MAMQAWVRLGMILVGLSVDYMFKRSKPRMIAGTDLCRAS